MARARPAKETAASSTPTTAPVNSKGFRVSKSTPSSPKKARTPKPRPTCYWPICEEVTAEFKDMFKFPFNIPDVRYLCYLNKEEAWVYEKTYFWIKTYIASIIKNHQWGCLSKKGIKWETVFPIFYELVGPGWTQIKTSGSLSMAFTRASGEIKKGIIAHNERVKDQTLEDRARTTINFLRLVRDPAERDIKLKANKKENEDEWKEGHPARPLIPKRDVLHLVERQHAPEFGTDVTEEDPHADHPLLPEDNQEVDVWNEDDEDSDDEEEPFDYRKENYGGDP